MKENIDNKLLEELYFYLNREFEKLNILFDEIYYTGDKIEIWRLVRSYWEDCKYFYSSQEYIKAFELVNYIWGMLDILANLNMIYIPDKYRKWFKLV